MSMTTGYHVVLPVAVVTVGVWLLGTCCAQSLSLEVKLSPATRRKLDAMCRNEFESCGIMISRWIAGIWRSVSGSKKINTTADISTSDLIPIMQASTVGDVAAYSVALQRPSFFDADFDDEPVRSYTLRTDFKKLVRIAGQERRLIMSWTTGGPKRWSIAHNLALSIRRNTPHLERRFVIVGLDREALTRAEAAGFHAVLNEGSGDLQDDIWKMRWLIQATCVSLGLEVLVVDSDIVFLSDPFVHLKYDADMEAMTDHFFPAQQLWATWLRPAEHINTGFVFVRPSARLLTFLVEFIDDHYHGLDGSVPRDGMDQRVFNKFVISKFEANPPGVFGMYENMTFTTLDWQAPPQRFLPHADWQLPHGSGNGPVSVRLLDPVCISHGMNFFWLKAYKLGRCEAPGSRPAVVHVNGVDPKMYFLRDRNLWYVDDWEERFGKDPYFLMYHHPGGQSLKDDFEYLVAALEVAAYLRRRVVLPETMNCANCPAYKPYRLDETMRDEPGCTYDYFAHANGLYEVYSRLKYFAVEAGTAREPQFRRLLASNAGDLPGLAELQQTGALRDEILAMQDTPSRAAFSEHRVLRLPEDMRALRDGLRQGAFGLRMNAERVFSCAFQQPLIGAMACLDEPYIEEFGEGAKCPAASLLEGCGPVGLCCCWPFWGWGEKLQYFTGVPWDLPCNCGIDVCERYDRPRATAQGKVGSDQCCRHTGSDALFPTTDPGVFYCKSEGEEWEGATAPEDSYTYTSFALTDFAKGKRTAPQTFETCRMDRMLRRGDAFRELSLRTCSLQVSTFLLRHSSWTQLRTWLDFQLIERRGVGNESLVTVAIDDPNQTDNTGFTHGKLAHDVDQLEYLGSLSAAAADTSEHLEWLTARVLPRFRQLSRRFDRFRAGEASREAVELDFAAARPYFNRALHVPALAAPDGTPTFRLGPSDVAAAEASLRQEGFAVLDGALTPLALSLARSWFVGSTVWHQTLSDGTVLKAQLRDSLHASIGFQVARELAEQHFVGLLGRQPLLDIVAYKHGEGSRGIGAHCVDGLFGALLWVAEDEADLSRERSSFSTTWGAASAAVTPAAGLRLFDTPTSAQLCPGGLRVGPPLATNAAAGLGAAPRSVDGPVRPQPGSHVSVPFRSNRLVVWRASRAVEILHDGSSWTREFTNLRVDWVMLFGRSRADFRGAGQFVPSFEGKSDEWGGHYYAQDHDHR